MASEAQDEGDFSKDDPEIVQLMFDFLYLQSYDHEAAKQRRSEQSDPQQCRSYTGVIESNNSASVRSNMFEVRYGFGSTDV